MIISTESELAAFCARAAAFDAVAVDTEFLRERTFHPRLCLIQVGTPDESVAIDPIALAGHLDPLAALFTDASTVKVFHACTQDMEVLLNALGVLPAPIFDTQVAAAFLGERLQIAYNGLVQTFCGVTLPKTESLTDWSRRPLTDQQIEYALDDVRYLIRAYAVIRERLERAGRLWWVLDELRPLTERAHYETDRRLAYKRVKCFINKRGISQLKPQCIAFGCFGRLTQIFGSHGVYFEFSYCIEHCLRKINRTAVF